jgi:hypothetical protein
MTVLSLAFVLVPFIPGVRDLPRWIPIYKVIWRDHYRTHAVPDTQRPEGEIQARGSPVI